MTRPGNIATAMRTAMSTAQKGTSPLKAWEMVMPAMAQQM